MSRVNKMRVLVLEDSPERHEGFRFYYGGGDLTIVDNYFDCIQALGKGEYDLVCLDHDLNDFGKRSVGPGMYGDTEYNGADVAWWMATQYDRRPVVLVHSWNPPGAKAIAQTLEKAGFKVVVKPYEHPIKEDR